MIQAHLNPVISAHAIDPARPMEKGNVRFEGEITLKEGSTSSVIRLSKEDVSEKEMWETLAVLSKALPILGARSEKAMDLSKWRVTIADTQAGLFKGHAKRQPGYEVKQSPSEKSFSVHVAAQALFAPDAEPGSYFAGKTTQQVVEMGPQEVKVVNVAQQALPVREASKKAEEKAKKSSSSKSPSYRLLSAPQSKKDVCGNVTKGILFAMAVTGLAVGVFSQFS